MLKRLLIAVLLPLLLLISQHQLLAHEISHTPTPSQQQHKHQAPHSDFCSQCAQSAGLAAGLLPEILSVTALQTQTCLADEAQISALSTCGLPFSARAPPSIL